jgi:hypothetical protein
MHRVPDACCYAAVITNELPLHVGDLLPTSCPCVRCSRCVKPRGECGAVLQVLPTTPHQVQEMTALAGVQCVENWEDLDHSMRWGTIIVAVKTHWLPHIALEMSCMQARLLIPPCLRLPCPRTELHHSAATGNHHPPEPRYRGAGVV